MKFSCPQCQTEIEADATIGDIGECPACGCEFRVVASGILQPTSLLSAQSAHIRVPRHEAASPRIRIQAGASAAAQARAISGSSSIASRSLVYEGSGMASSVLLWLFNPFYGIIAVTIAGISSAFASVGDTEKAVVFSRAGKPVRLIGWILTIIVFVVLAMLFIGGCLASSSAHNQFYRSSAFESGVINF